MIILGGNLSKRVSEKTSMKMKHVLMITKTKMTTGSKTIINSHIYDCRVTLFSHDFPKLKIKFNHNESFYRDFQQNQQ